MLMSSLTHMLANTGTCGWLTCPHRHVWAALNTYMPETHATDSTTCPWPFVSVNVINHILSQDMEREQDDRREVHEQAVICLSFLLSLSPSQRVHGPHVHYPTFSLPTAGVMGIVNHSIFEL